MGFDLVPRSPLNSVQSPPKANSGRSSFSANQTTSFFFVSGFGSGAYSAKLFAGTKQRFSGFNQPRQWGEVVLRILVTGAWPARGGGGIPQRIMVSSRSAPALRTTGAGKSGKTPGIGGRLPTYRFSTRKSAMMAAWFVVML